MLEHRQKKLAADMRAGVVSNKCSCLTFGGGADSGVLYFFISFSKLEVHSERLECITRAQLSSRKYLLQAGINFKLNVMMQCCFMVRVARQCISFTKKLLYVL